MPAQWRDQKKKIRDCASQWNASKEQAFPLNRILAVIGHAADGQDQKDKAKKNKENFVVVIHKFRAPNQMRTSE
jgi:hypothetical protein